VSKLGGKKLFVIFLRINGLERTTKTIPVRIFADMTFFQSLSGINYPPVKIP